MRELVSFENIERYIQDERIAGYRTKVLKTFIRRNKLVKLPVQRKKRIIILEEFVKKFDHNKKYKEEAVNDIIKHTFDDYCTIRRLMIEEGYMTRENQVYRLTNNGDKK